MLKTPCSLLIAEDDDALLKCAESCIRANSSLIGEIFTAQNGRLALELIARRRPALMLLDIMLPELDGLSVMREAKSAGICPRTVILSGYGTFIHAREAFMLGAADFLQKPCPEFEILSKLEKLISPMEPERGHIPEGAGRPGSVVSEALAFMEAHYPEALTLSQVAKKIGVSPNYLSALFSKTAHVGFTEKLNRLRIERACEYFAAGGVRTYEVAFKVGFKDEKYFSNVFKKIMGVSPSQYRKSL